MRITSRWREKEKEKKRVVSEQEYKEKKRTTDQRNMPNLSLREQYVVNKYTDIITHRQKEHCCHWTN